MARSLLGIDWKVEGHENLPARPAVILSKHQSAWETMAFQLIFPPQVYVLKRELLWIPFFGWGLALMSPIAIDRSRGFAALRTIARRGRERLEQGFWVVVFPEGTRVAPGERRAYHLGGAWLARGGGAPVVPVAHNAGLVWPRNAFLKRPGTVTVRIGPPIEAANRDPKMVNELAKDMDRRTAEGAYLIDLGGRGRGVPLRAPAPAHASASRSTPTGSRCRRRCARHGARSRRFVREKERWIVRKLDEWWRAPRPALVRGHSGERCRSSAPSAGSHDRGGARCTAGRAAAGQRLSRSGRGEAAVAG